jgi:hypothetical protein
MAFLSDEQLADLSIERMIFHVVGPKEEQLTLLNEVDPGEHEGFFLDRIRSTNNGLMFDFIEGSALLHALRTVDRDQAQFAEQSKALARLFQGGHVGNASVGALLVFVLRSGLERFYALVKYDHETVLSYTIEGEDALMSALHDTFVKAPEALQKSAFVRLTENGGELSVKDRSSPTKGSKYFQAFLGAKRRFGAKDLTEKLSEVTKRVALENKDVLGPAVMRSVGQRIYEFVQQQESFDPANKEPFLVAVFGALPEDSKVRKDFDKALKRERIESEAFDFDKEAVKRPSKTRLTTREGIQITWDKQYDGQIQREDTENGGVRIIIESMGVQEEHDYTETNTRRR